ncbi:hypothetical protein BH11CYA1_BH11CYA1_50510 [soil metagenome]
MNKCKIALIATCFSTALNIGLGLCSAAAAQTFQLGTEQTHVIPQALQAGETFNAANLPKQNINGWYRIPHWFAGLTERTRVYSDMGGSIKDVRRRERGRQVDNKGHVWEARREPIRYDIEEKNMIVHTVLTEELPLKVARDQVVMRYFALMICENIKTHRIIKSFQTQQIHVFVPNADGSINATIDQAVYFDAAGVFQNTLATRASYVEQKLADFVPTDRDDTFDYKGSFIRFLESTGQSALIPTNSAPQAPPSYQAPPPSPMPIGRPIPAPNSGAVRQ